MGSINVAMDQTISAVTLNTKEEQEELRKTLSCMLPSSVEVYNCLVLQLRQDGVEREIVVNKGFSKDDLIAVVVDKSENPRLKIILFCTPDDNKNFRHFLQNNLNFRKPLLFGVGSH